MKMQMQDKVALVTGGASGLGRGISLVLAERGADVAVADINLEGAQKVTEELAQFGHKARAFQVDVTKRQQLQRMAEEAIAYFGRIDVLVNAAGVIGAQGFEDTTTSREEDWDITFDVNVKGTVLASEVVAEHMKGRRYGKIVNIASHAGRGGSEGNGAYGASKAAVIHLTQSFALGLAPYSINVNVVCPGTIWTPMWERIAERSKRNNPELRHLTTREIFDRAIQERCPLQREQTPEDIGKAVAFFASDDAMSITGQSLNVNGGTRMN
jgi:NAD(P)-dependent dehydrogenase (short-subunit alcohol dehydrogenase family)